MLEATATPTRTAVRQREILDAALLAFDELGYDATTIAHIQERSGASIGSIYHHFDGKEAIAATLYEAALAHYRQGLLERAEGAKNARDLVRSVVLFHLEWGTDHPIWARYLLRMRHADGVIARETALRQGTQDFLRRMHALLEPHVQGGHIMRLPASLYPLIIIGPAQDMLRHWLAGRLSLDPRSVASTLADLAWKAVRAEGTPAGGHRRRRGDRRSG
jgi:AcrR family transcriptional regulator